MDTTNITIKIESDLARDARVMAARKGTSISRLVADELHRMVREDQVYAAAKSSALGQLKLGFDLDWDKPEYREDLHNREILR